jgi:hypothetical protein
MDNQNSNIDLDMTAFKFLEFARKSVLITNMSLAEAMGQGIFSTHEVFNGDGGYMIMGVRPNSTALAATYSGKRILWSELALEKNEDLELHHKLHAIDCSDDHMSDLAWTNLVDQIEEWVKCEREEIDLDYR